MEQQQEPLLKERVGRRITKSPAPHSMNKLSSQAFYSEYHGHRIADLDALLLQIRTTSNREHSSIFFAGDSSLDNKFWFPDTAAAVNGYEDILDPPRSRKDVAYCTNAEIVSRELNMTVVNCAIEESTIGGRACGNLPAQDKFIRDHVQENDIVVVSVGGNDIALKPSPCTAVNACLLAQCTPWTCLKHACGTALPCDDCFAGCVCSCASNLCAFPCGYGYFLHLFGTRAEAYLKNLVSKRKPKKIVICMIYYVDEKTTGSWADTTLGLLGYNSNPKQLQMLTRKVFEDATKRIRVEGTEVVACPLFVALDGKKTEYYAQRVEPSAKGGAQMATLILDAIVEGTPAMEARLSKHDAERMDR